ncbi:MAG: toll/interleukin-1 receptor domain-containing protein [Chitinophagaceae bacterium]|nr:toll/interleukin-1 receptor domain-containing protein [Chitinophagaceae bacterium]
MSDKFFISYSRVDTPFVLKLANDLKNAGANIWLDQLNIPPGAHWDNEIEAALNSATCVLAIISPQSMESKNAMDEISFALEQNKKVIPVLLTNTETSFRLRRLQRIDFTGEYEKGVNQLLKAIQITDDNNDSKKQGTAHENTDNKNVFPEGFVFAKKTDTGDNFSSKRPPSYAKRADQDDEIVTPQRLTTEDLKNIIQDHLSITKQTLPTKKTGNKNKALYGIIIFATVIATAGVTWGIFKNNKQPADIKIQDEIHPVPIIITSTDSTHNPNKIKKDIAGTEEKKQTPEVIQPVPVIITPVVKNKPANTNTLADTKTENVDKPSAEKKEKPEHEKKEQPPAPDSTTKQQVLTPVKQSETTPQPELPKEMLINTEILFEVVFERLPDMKFKREYQPVTFVVTSPVTYNGITIINKGAIAKGAISLGSVHTSMIMKHVEGADGQIIALKLKDGIPMNKIKMNEPYKVFIKKGTKLFF